MTNYVSINPGPQTEPDQDFGKEFAALVHVKSSRYAEHSYQEGSGIASKVGIKWVMGTTKGNTFDRTWPTGLDWEENKDKISPDGKKIAVSIRKNSDATYFLQKAINEAGFPSAKVTDDISVFEGETFFMATDQNPRSQGSKRKIYPKKYHPEGWDAALKTQQARQAEREAREAGGTPAATLTSSYTPPAVVVQPDVKKAAGEALTAIVTSAGGTVDRAGILRGLNTYDGAKTWLPSLREEVTRSLWDYNAANSIAKEFNLQVNGDAMGFTVSNSK